ncbi:Rho termination factor N-terminal domain-containing protein [Paenibacillus sp. Lou8.1]|uniref:Rho termination factor N-terminal domain-containing protein n=1 Tax=unclassified Paenibacillus TaxID=185978 RepID=UPI000FA61E4B|nr:Rho termination factor N-terminal domain-containing protein [Paenibacillus sp. Lou8.1]MCP3807135.1 Rho termination factor N-terminal domain-containing protein [Paenibacillus sp. Lou8.1]MCP3808470.1 Rho termination factor N-terminal domain-containing protein [Paenibacillus sp. Lou8.1]
MAYITYRGENTSLMLYGIRFVPKVPVLVDNESVIKNFRERSDFDIKEEKVIPLEDLTLIQLKDKAKAAGIKGFSNMNTQDLITALRGGGKPTDNTPPAGDPAKPEGADGKNADANNTPTA